MSPGSTAVACTGRSSFTAPTGERGTARTPSPSPAVAARALEAGALIATSGEQTSLFVAPPLIVTEDELMTILAAVDHGLALADEAAGGQAGA